jgi:hypothetical protein
MAEYGFTEGIDFNPLKIERVHQGNNNEAFLSGINKGSRARSGYTGHFSFL